MKCLFTVISSFPLSPFLVFPSCLIYLLRFYSRNYFFLSYGNSSHFYFYSISSLLPVVLISFRYPQLPLLLLLIVFSVFLLLLFVFYAPAIRLSRPLPASFTVQSLFVPYHLLLISLSTPSSSYIASSSSSSSSSIQDPVTSTLLNLMSGLSSSLPPHI